MKKARLIAISILLVFILLVIGGIVFTTRSETSSTAKSEPSNNNSYAELLRFVERSMTYPDSPFQKPVVILPGALPSDLPEKIPIPSDSETIGSLVRSDGKYNQVEIILDDPRDSKEVLEFYRNSLVKAGWNESKVDYPESGGFAPASPMSESVIFCRYEKKGPSLTVNAYTTDGGKPTDVRIQMDTNPLTPTCTQRFNEPNYGTSGVMPVLKAPTGALQSGGGSGNSGDESESYATLKTELNVTDLETHYRNQLVEAGWKLKDKGSGSSIAWSTWSFTDESEGNRSGILFVNDWGQENSRFVMFTVKLVS